MGDVKSYVVLGGAMPPARDGSPQGALVEAISNLIAAHMAVSRSAPIEIVHQAQLDLMRLLDGYVLEPIAGKASR